MTLEVPFNEKLYRYQTKLRFDLAWNAYLKSNKKNLFVSIPMIVFGLLLIFFELTTGYISLAFGLYFVFKYFHHYNSYKNRKAEYFQIIENEIKEELQTNQNAIWEFNNEYFRFKYRKGEIKTNWTEFTGYRIVNQNLLLDLGQDDGNSYILAEEEVGKDQFNKIVSIVDNKINTSAQQTA